VQKGGLTILVPFTCLLNLAFGSPHEDDYKATPLSLVADKKATFAITPSVRIQLVLSVIR
jgi:hypothetical protein